MNNVFKALFVSLFFISWFFIISNNSIKKENSSEKKMDIYVFVQEKYRGRIVEVSDSSRVSTSVAFLLKDTNYKELDNFILSLGFHKVDERNYCQGEQYMGFNFYDGIFYLNYFYPDDYRCVK